MENETLDIGDVILEKVKIFKRSNFLGCLRITHKLLILII